MVSVWVLVIVAGIDPGVTTGCVLVELLEGQVRVIEHRQIKALPVLMAWLHSLPEMGAVIVEDYIGSGHRHSYTIVTIQVIGAIKGWAAMHAQPLTMETPQKRKPFVKAARKALNVKHADRHAADALAHVLSWDHRRKK